jgi:hypothetical protein
MVEVKNMLIMETLGVTLLTSMMSALAMLFWMAAHSDKFFDKNNERYYKITMGGINPLNAIFSRDLLSEDGLRWRALIGKVLTVIWVAFVVAVIIESSYTS